MAIALSACGRPDNPNKLGQLPEPQPSASREIDTETLKSTIAPLVNVAHPLASNNAKRALDALESRDFVDVFLGLKKVATVNLQPNENELFLQSMEELKRICELAAKNGDQNAEYALELYRQAYE